MCGHEACRIAYGMILPYVRKSMPKTEFAGCCIEMEPSFNASSGEVELRVPEWACQNEECRFWWW